MRVLQVNSVCGRGSTGRIVVALHDALRARGDECRIAYGRGQHDPAVDAFRIGSSFSSGVHAGLSRLTDRQGFYSAGATRRLVNSIDEYRPDLVHLHNVHGYYLNLPMLFKSLARSNVRVVWTLHDCWAFTGHCAYFDLVGCDKWRTHCGMCPQKGAYPTSYGLDNSKRNFEDKRRMTSSLANLTVVSPSAWLAELVKQSFLMHHPVEVIKNGIDQTVFRPTETNFKAERGLEGRHIILGVASEWDERKGLRDFVELSRRLSDQYVVLLVGVDPATMRKLPPAIVSIARTDSATDLAAVYSAADVFFNPTYEDNYPTTNLEAISCGTPVLTYDTGGSPESVVGRRGIVVAQGDIEGVLAAIAEMSGWSLRADSPDEEYGVGAMSSKYLDLYDRQVR